MKTYSLAHLADQTLLSDLASLVARDRTTTAELLAHLAEVDARQLYLPAAYPSMFAYCVGELRLSEDVAAKRIQAARVARRFPAIFDAVAQGRLHLSAVVLLAPHLTEDTADGLLAAATHQSKAGIERLLAERFPRPGLLAWVAEIPGPSAPRSAGQHAPGHVGEDPRRGPGRSGEQDQHAPGHVGEDSPRGPGRSGDQDQHAPGHVGEDPRRGPGRSGDQDQHAPGHVGEDSPRGPGRSGDQDQHAPGHVADGSTVRPLAPKSFAVQCTISQSTHDKLRYAQQLLGHQIPSGDIAMVLDRALDALIDRLEQRKFAATSRPRTAGLRSTGSARHIPAHVKRTVWDRDGGRCTFVSETGRRCLARTRLEFDHVDEVARAGDATVTGIRLRCRAHNQYTAECTFGAEFMRQKRRAAAEARSVARASAMAAVRAHAAAAEQAPVAAGDRDVVPWLRQLGFSAAEARRAAARCAHLPDASLEQRVRVALSCVHVRGTRAGAGLEAALHGAAPLGDRP